MRRSYGMTLRRQIAALGKTRRAAALMKRSKVKYLRSSNLMRKRRNSRNAGGPSGLTETENIVQISDTSVGETQSVTSVEEEHVVNDEIDEGNVVPEHESSRGLINSSATLTWGKNGQRSNNRNNAKNIVAARNNRLSKLIDHLGSSQQNDDDDDDDDELVIFIKLVSLEERRVPNLPRPYLSCRPTLSVKQLCQYVAYQTSLQTEEVELYLVRESQSNVISGDGNVVLDNDNLEFLTGEEETLAELKTDDLNSGYLVIAYKRKMWNLNVVLSQDE
ncbi:hypothetical protein RJT34_15971 [Clitoria ternatea]|uniref:Uncharacterized protein n=1 Tax=Clitoria ternatea TaxID=43366 RepID=A0AAN9J6D0_CLITE